MGLQAWLLHYPHVALGVMVGVLYLSDCFVLSSARHLLGTSEAGGRILGLLSPGRVVIVRGEVLYLLPPLRPWRPLHRIALNGGRAVPPPATAAGPIAITRGAAVLILLGALGLLTLGAHPAATLACLVILYATGFLCALALRACMPGIGWLRVLQCTLCPPYALNLLRRTTLAQPPTSVADALGPLQSTRELQRMRQQIAPLREVLDQPWPAMLALDSPDHASRQPL